MSELKLVHFSDTHNKHLNIKIPDGDVLIYSGDCCNVGAQWEMDLFFRWFTLQPHKYKIYVAGTRDRGLDISRNMGMEPFWVGELKDKFTKYESLNFYLEDEGCEIEGIKFWGSPYTKAMNSDSNYWAFSEPKHLLRKHWKDIPNDVDVLITHSAPYGKMDFTKNFDHDGCEYLRWHVKTKKPKVHMFGHIHEDYGMTYDEDTIYVNGSICDENYMVKNEPHILTINAKKASYKF